MGQRVLVNVRCLLGLETTSGPGILLEERIGELWGTFKETAALVMTSLK